MWGCSQDLCCHLYFSAVVVDVTELVRECLLGDLLYVDNLVLMSVMRVEGLRNKFLEWKEAFESKGLKVNLGKPK